MTRHYEPAPTVSGPGTIDAVDDPPGAGPPRTPYLSRTEVHGRFVGLNRRFTAACTDWQIRP